MIEIRAVCRAGRCSLTAHGHAGAAAQGQDIVCAGVSALVHTLAAALAAFAVDGAETRLAAGQAALACADGGLSRTLFYQAVLGLALIARRYPSHVRLEIEGFFADDRQEEST